MDTFIHSVLNSLHKEQLNLSKLTYVVPSRRVATFLNKAIAQYIKHPVFEPIIYSVEDFISHTAGVEIASDVDLLFDFYDSYKKTETTAHLDSIDEFITWAPTILKDFNEIDRFLVDPSQFFNYLGNLKELEQGHWSILEPKTEMIKKYLHFWNRLESYYYQFKEDCITKGMVYQGLAYRLAFAKAEHSTAQYTTQNQLIFLGLNALNKSEEEIIQEFLKSGIARIYWDSDRYFQEETYHEAGRFLRRYKEEWSYYKQHDFNISSSHFTQEKELHIMGTSGPIGMAQAAGKVLQELVDNKVNLNKTALILADEALLLPVISAIPDSIKHLNITMGLTLDKTPLASFFNLLIQLKVAPNENGFYYKNVIAILESHFCTILDPTATRETLKYIHKENKVYIAHNYKIPQLPSDLLDLLFKPITTASDLISYLTIMVQQLQIKLMESSNRKLELEQLLGISSVIEQLQAMILQQVEITEIRTIQFLFQQLLPQKKLDFIGEPVSGLQVMGLLETRALDYEHIIMLSINEGILPAGKSTASYIPYDMKTKFGLPTYSDKDSVYAYHFYRLLQRCKTAHLVYNSEASSLGGGDKSRFIKQLETSNIKNHQITQKIYANKVSTEQTLAFSISKDDHYFNRLDEIALSGFSPSSITSYIYNPLDFYSNKILKIKDVEEVEEDMAANTMGTMVHKALEELYKPCIDQIMDLAHIKTMRSQLNSAIHKAYLDSYKTTLNPQGKNIIMYEVAKHYASKMIAYDEKLLKNGHSLIIKSLETRYHTTLDIKSIGSVKLHGEVDRIDELDGTMRIIDYKSGMVSKANVGIIAGSYDALITDYGKSKAFQVLMYAYLYAQNNPFTSCSAGIISFKNFKEGFISYGIKDGGRSYEPKIIDHEELDKFEEQLKAIILELYNKDIDLTEIER